MAKATADLYSSVSRSPKRTRTRSESTMQETCRFGKTHLSHTNSLTAVSPSVLSESDGSNTSGTYRRRVNPASLASRLGPELIKELESLLQPGMTEMPSFAARQTIQKKYNVDRRHIYDWFHTKGFRVATKEKPEDRKSLRPRPERKIRQRPVPGSETSSSGNPDENCLIPRNATPDSSLLEPLAPLDMIGEYLLYEAASQPSAFPIQYFLEPPTASAEGFYGTFHSSSLGSEPSEHPSFLSNYHLPSVADLNTQMAKSPDQDTIPLAMESFNTEAIDEQARARTETTNTYFPLFYEQPLPQEQRESYYQCLAEAVGPASGVQESVGTYRAFMSQQSQTYYERLAAPPLPTARQAKPNITSLIPLSLSVAALSSLSARSQASIPSAHHPVPDISRSGSADSVSTVSSAPSFDYGKWLLYGRSAAPSPAFTPSVSGLSSPAVLMDDHSLWPWSASQTPEFSSSESALEISDILESPVLRSRHSSCNQSSDPIPSSPQGPIYGLGIPGVQEHMIPMAADWRSPEFPIPCQPLNPFAFSSHFPQSSSPVNGVSPYPCLPQSYDFSVSLRTAKEAHGLDRTVAATATREKGKKTRPRRLTANSAGGVI